LPATQRPAHNWFGCRGGREEILGTLYVVGTPIGNLEDITLRALRVLAEVDLIAAEDTRVTRVLLNHHGIRTPLAPFHEFSRAAAVDKLLARLQQGDVALVSDAGMPGISDPGYRLVRGAIDAGLEVVPVPGPSAVIAALAVSGLPTHSFTFVGFLPRKSGQRRRLFEQQRERGETLVAFESPHRLLAALNDLAAVLPERQTAVARELTKRFEQVVRGTASVALAAFQSHPPRGEITLLVAGRASAEVES
jgi:16S rRNA (cytidine1402-2'-O)-methyltransferase